MARWRLNSLTVSKEKGGRSRHEVGRFQVCPVGRCVCLGFLSLSLYSFSSCLVSSFMLSLSKPSLFAVSFSLTAAKSWPLARTTRRENTSLVVLLKVPTQPLFFGLQSWSQPPGNTAAASALPCTSLLFPKFQFLFCCELKRETDQFQPEDSASFRFQRLNRLICLQA